MDKRGGNDVRYIYNVYMMYSRDDTVRSVRRHKELQT